MSLVNQFQITLKDFWPEHPDGMFVTDRDRGTATTISCRLYTRLRAYAEEPGLPFHSVVQQLRDGIHAAPSHATKSLQPISGLLERSDD